MDSPLILSFSEFINPATALVVDTILFTVPTGAEYEVMEVIECHTVAGTNGSDVTALITKMASGVALGSGTTITASTFNLKSTADVPVSKSAANGGLSSDPNVRRLRSGERLAVNFTGTMTALEGMNLTLVLKRLRSAEYR